MVMTVWKVTIVVGTGEYETYLICYYSDYEQALKYAKANSDIGYHIERIIVL